jgi:hypothetical protein
MMVTSAYRASTDAASMPVMPPPTTIALRPVAEWVSGMGVGPLC